MHFSSLSSILIICTVNFHLIFLTDTFNFRDDNRGRNDDGIALFIQLERKRLNRKVFSKCDTENKVQEKTREKVKTKRDGEEEEGE